MKHLILLCVAFIFSACTTAESLFLEPLYQTSYSSTMGNGDENLMLKKAVVKLIRKYNKLNEKTIKQAKEIKRLDNRATRHDKEIKNISSGMNTIKKSVPEGIEDEYSIEVGLPVVNLRSSPSIDANNRRKGQRRKKT